MVEDQKQDQVVQGRRISRKENSVNSYATGMLEKENKKEARCHFCEGVHKWMNVRKLSRKQLKKEVNSLARKSYIMVV